MSVGNNINRDTAQGQGDGAGQDPTGTGPLRGQDDVPMPEVPSSPNRDTDDENLTDGDDDDSNGGDDGDETMDATGGVDSFIGGGGNTAAPFGMAAGTSLMGGMNVVGVAGVAGTIGGGSVVLNGLLNEEPPTPHYARAPGTRRRYNPDKYLPSGRLRPTDEAAAGGRRDLGSNLVTDVQALRTRRARRRAMTLPHDVEEAELLAAAGGAGTGGGGGGGDDSPSTAPNADAAPTAAAAINEEGEAAASQQQPRRPRRRHSSSPTRFSVERHSGAILEDLMAVMGLNDENSSLGGNDSSARPFNPWGESQ